MNARDLDILEHIANYCNEITSALQRFGDDLDSFLADKDYQAAVSMRLLNIGELAKGLSKEFKDETSSRIPWAQVSGLRDRTAHGYSSLRFEDIFITAKDDIPVLAAFCKEQIKE